jgi:ABC-type glycerol-3-phosphate transport system permease component
MARDIRISKKVLSYFVLILLAFFFLGPLLWMFSTSLKDRTSLFNIEWFSLPWHWENYTYALTMIPFWNQLKNTLIVVVLNIIGQLLVSSLVAYGFARLESPVKKPMFILVLATMMIPSATMVIPSYILFKHLGWIDTLLPLTVPAFFGHAYNIFLLKIFYQKIPFEYDEAARLDGAGYLRIWWQLLLPLTKPVLATIAVFTFQNNWNDFFGPLIYLQSVENFTLQLGLASFSGMYRVDWTSLMAAATVIMIPCAFVFVVAQKYFAQSLSITGLKE